MSIDSILDRLFEKRVTVNCDRDPYLHRWYVFKTRRISLFVHKFVRSDEDRALHDHPWSFLVVPVWRGYIEHSDRPMDNAEYITALLGAVDCYSVERFLKSVSVVSPRAAVVSRVLPILGTRYREATYRHRVQLLTDTAGNPLPAWSLFFHFEKVRDWGFWDKVAGFIQWNKWWQDKCE